jgi:hypothetical protein
MNYRIPKNLRPLAARISKGIQLAIRAGWRIRSGTYRNEILKCMCPIGALHFLEESPVCSPVPGVSIEDENDFVNAFDGYESYVNSRRPYARLGRAFRERFIGS